MGRVRDLLRDGHHAFERTKCGVALLENPGGALEEVFAGQQLIGHVLRLWSWAHGGTISQGEQKGKKIISVYR
jgi:hypothetical protein